jgi:hypothetical protein
LDTFWRWIGDLGWGLDHGERVQDGFPLCYGVLGSHHDHLALVLITSSLLSSLFLRPGLCLLATISAFSPRLLPFRHDCCLFATIAIPCSHRRFPATVTLVTVFSHLSLPRTLIAFPSLLSPVPCARCRPHVLIASSTISTRFHHRRRDSLAAAGPLAIRAGVGFFEVLDRLKLRNPFAWLLLPGDVKNGGGDNVGGRIDTRWDFVVRL